MVEDFEGGDFGVFTPVGSAAVISDISGGWHAVLSTPSSFTGGGGGGVGFSPPSSSGGGSGGSGSGGGSTPIDPDPDPILPPDSQGSYIFLEEGLKVDVPSMLSFDFQTSGTSESPNDFAFYILGDGGMVEFTNAYDGPSSGTYTLPDVLEPGTYTFAIGLVDTGEDLPQLLSTTESTYDEDYYRYDLENVLGDYELHIDNVILTPKSVSDESSYGLFAAILFVGLLAAKRRIQK